jgi:S1-C subfamily serine protease
VSRPARAVLAAFLAACAAVAWSQPAAPPAADSSQSAPGAPANGAPPPAAASPAASAPLSSAAEAVYAEARPRLLQIRTLVQSAGGQTTLGSGFVVSPRGFALTNYHVVSQYALEPSTYRLEYVAADGSTGPLKLHAIDVANDLAVVQLDRTGMPFFTFDDRAVKGVLPKGERLFAMGNPLDLGFTIVEGTYNGLVDKSYNERIHFSGALNPGMSGGPTVTANGSIAGVNVAKQIGGDLVSFLVPARHAAALLARAEGSGPMTPEEAKAEIGRQLVAWQSTLYAALAERGFRQTTLGPYAAPESAASWFSCWSRTNAGETPKPRALANQTSCSTQASLFVSNDIDTGQVDLGHIYARSVDLNAFQFASFLSDIYHVDSYGRRKVLTPARCQEDFVTTGEAAMRPLLRVVWCARAYRDFEGLYDVSVMAVTQDRSREALVSRLVMRGASYANAQALGRRFLDAIEVAK